MAHRRCSLAGGVVALLCSSALLAPAAMGALTPDGPATLSSVWRGAQTAEGRSPSVLEAVKVTVGPGGAAGMVRARVSDLGVDPARGVQLGEWTMLPAEPGTYTIPAPRLDYDDRSLVLGLDQQTGGHAIVRASDCRTELGRYGDLCQVVSLDAWTPILPDAAPAIPSDGASGGSAPTTRQPGEQLQIAPVGEADRDRDLAADTTEDRTDLTVSASAVRGPGGRMTITVTNHGPRTAGLPMAAVDRTTTGPWAPSCATATSWFASVPPAGFASACSLPALAPGSSETVSLPTIDDGRPVTVAAVAEGPDLNPADNTVEVVPSLAPAPVVRMAVASRARAGRIVKLTFHSDKTAKAAVRMRLRHGRASRLVKRALALPAGETRTLALRLVRVRGALPTGRAQLTVTFTAAESQARVVRRAIRIVQRTTRAGRSTKRAQPDGGEHAGEVGSCGVARVRGPEWFRPPRCS
jgi:hypothetical protein